MLLLISPYSRNKRIFRFSVFGAYALFIIVGFILAFPIPIIDMLDGLARYILAVPAAMLAALALRAQGRTAREQGRVYLSTSLMIASFGFAIYTLTQFFVHSIDMFPARYINEESFLAAAGFPVQLIRTFTAISPSV